MENIIQQVDSTTFEFQKYISSDENILLSFPLDTQYNLEENYIEYFIYDENNRLVPSSNYITSNYSVINGDVVLNPELDLSNNYYDRGSYYIQYNFLKNLLKSSFNTPYYITEINSDRTEIRLSSNVVSKDDIIGYTNIFIQYRELSSYFVDFYLNFGDNSLVIANNIKLDNNGDDVSVIIKLYEALPIQFGLKQQLTIVEQISTPQTYLVKFASQLDEFIDYEHIKGPNFDIKSSNYGNTLSYVDSNLLTSSNSMYNQLYNIVRNNSLNINIDYEEFANFIHFSSAEYRLKSFYTKISLLEEYNEEINNFLSHISGSSIYIQNKQIIENQKNNIIHNFDEYENFLYFNSGSLNSWPKKNNTIPYDLYSVTSSIAQIWWENQIESASNYDQNNQNWLYWSIPEYLRDNSQNKNYEIFLNMIGHHYDNIWVYIDTISNKFNADNRINYGISKNLVADSIQDFGLKLYSNNFSTNDLYTNFIGVTENGSLFPFPEITSTLPATSGKEYIDTKISASDDIIPLEDINKRIYKRLYHNIPYLLKTKGTPQGLRALTNIFGISPNILSVKEYGNKTHYSASYYSTIYDNIITGSDTLPDGNTLSNLISIQPKNDNIYLPNYLEIAFSPQDSINNDILTDLGEFNIGEYIGDPSHISLKDYPDLKILRENYFTKYLNKYDVNDFIRLIKYFDNSLFKMLKDFIPVKIDSSTGIVIKPHILERNKHNLTSASKEDLLYTSSIFTENIYSSSGGTGGVFNNDISQKWNQNIIFPYNLTSSNSQSISISDNREFYNGELPNSFIYTQLNYSLNSSSFNQSDNIRINPNLQDVDYTTNISTPINIQAINNYFNHYDIHNVGYYGNIGYGVSYYNYIGRPSTINCGTVPESNYTQKSFRISRYDGSKISSLDINNTGSLTGSFGKSAPVESKKAYFAYIHEIVDPYPLINDKTYFKVKYLIDEQTNINNPLLDRSTYYNLIDTFTNIENIKSSLNIPKQESQFIRLNNEQSVFKTAQIAVPILYTQTSATNYSDNLQFSSSLSIPLTYWNYTTTATSSLDNINNNSTNFDFTPDYSNNINYINDKLYVYPYSNYSPLYNSSRVTLYNTILSMDEYSLTYDHILYTSNIGNTINNTGSLDIFINHRNAGSPTPHLSPITLLEEKITFNCSNNEKFTYNISDVLSSDFIISSDNIQLLFNNTNYNSFISANNIENIEYLTWNIKIKTVGNLIPTQVPGANWSGLKFNANSTDIVFNPDFINDKSYSYIELLNVTNLYAEPNGLSVYKETGYNNKIYINNQYMILSYNQGYIQTPMPYTSSFSNRFKNNFEPYGTGFPKIADQWKLEIGDEIRFENNEDKCYKIINIDPFYFSDYDGGPIISITLDRDIPSSTNLNFFLIRRYKESPDNIIINQTFPYTNPLPSASLAPSTTGFIFPKYPIDSIATGSDRIIRDLIDKKIIE